MLAMIRSMLSYKFFPLCWTALTIFLLCLPGSMVPGTGIFSIKHFDKIVHVFLFGMNVLLWGWHYAVADRPKNQFRNMVAITTVLTIALGIILEFIQLNYIPNRSFDTGDIVADTVGALIAGFWVVKN